MCLAVPGQIISLQGDTPLSKTGKVNFSGVIRDVNLSYLPDAQAGDYVIVHVGFALSKVDREEAEKTIADIAEIEKLGKEKQEEELK